MVNLNLRRPALASASALALALCFAASAEAGPVKLRFRGGVPSGVDQTVTLRVGEDAFVSMKPWLDTVPAENDITCVITGAVPMRVAPFSDPYMTQVSGTRTWVKRELIPFTAYTSKTAATADYASVGNDVGRWTCSAKDGADDGGATSTWRIAFNVTDQPQTTFDYGANSRVGHGGPAVAAFPGSAANKSITAQSTPGAFAIASQTGGIAFAGGGAYGSTTRAVGTPTVGASAYWVDLTDSVLAQTWRLTFNIIANRTDIAPGATGDTTSSNQALTVLGGDAQCFGGQIVSEDGAFPGLGGSMNGNVVAACASTPAVTAPTAPYVDAAGTPTYAPDGRITTPTTANAGITTAHPGWTTFYCRTPLGCDIGSGILNNNRSGAAFYLHFHNVKGAIEPRTITATNGVHWLMYSYGQPVGATATGQVWNFTRDYATNLFQVDNHYLGGGGLNVGTLALNGRDSQIVGNTFDDIYGDRVLYFAYNSSIGAGRAHVSWNLHKNLPTACDAHIDNFQASMSATVTLYRDLAAGTEVEWADNFGNVGARTGGDYYGVAGADFGKACAGASEQFYIGNHGGVYTRSDVKHRLRFVGNFTNDLNAWGFDLPALTSTSVLANNMNTWAYEVTSDALAGTGPNALGAASNTSTVSFQPVDAASEAGIGVYRNIRINSTASTIWSLGNTVNPLTSPVLADNWAPGYGANSAGLTNMLAQFENPIIGAGAQTMADFMAAFAGKTGSVPLSSAKPAGPFAPKARRLIDHRRRTYSAEILTP
jgi:hypothetical protein